MKTQVKQAKNQSSGQKKNEKNLLDDKKLKNISGGMIARKVAMPIPRKIV
ncbi:hypothetical protein BN59_01830 [Legionella massiliensis]|uniref:Uncharacterized protein n=1 Tax=Legionella massiliensis TaxID=1034943 RepID=A0A078KWZ1_9GAMM|nr:bacteriocin [Legionella massiliensis]CDZ77547.1 hypothetical protein BN59_01830 [Legionella massiliensis]CEE13285.1 hypothetical protein BN1094_01830 [Legionella massiliensis]